MMTKIITILILTLIIGGCSINNEVKLVAEDLRLGAIDAIPAFLSIDGVDKSIEFTDENIGEDFIIKTDSYNYYGFGGNSLVYFTITNVSKTNQNGDVAFSFSDKKYISSIRKFVRNEEVTETKLIPATATSTEQEISTKVTKTIWEYLPIFKIDIPKITRKSVKNRITDKGFTDFFKVGETKVYIASVRIPVGTQNDEWFIEVFGDSSYGHLDPNLWTHEQTFNDLTNGGLTGQDSYTTLISTAGAVDVVTTGTPYEGAKHVFCDNGSAGTDQIKRNITGIESGTMYFSVKFATAPVSNAFWIEPTSGDAAGVYFRTGNKIVVHVGTTLTDTGTTFSTDTYHRIGIRFECGAGAWEGLSADTWQWNIDDGSWSSALNFYNNNAFTEMNRFYYSSGIDSYFDFISPTFDIPVSARRIIPVE